MLDSAVTLTVEFSVWLHTSYSLTWQTHLLGREAKMATLLTRAALVTSRTPVVVGAVFAHVESDLAHRIRALAAGCLASCQTSSESAYVRTTQRWKKGTR
jgi:hypothetical protein